MTRAALITAALAAALLTPMSAHAQRLRVPGAAEFVAPQAPPKPEPRTSARPPAEANDYSFPLGEVVAGLSRRAPGKMLDAKKAVAGGRPVYLVSWAAEGGRRLEFVVDAKSGAVLSQSGG